MTQDDERPLTLLGDMEMNTVRLDRAMRHAASCHSCLRHDPAHPLDQSWIAINAPRL